MQNISNNEFGIYICSFWNLNNLLRQRTYHSCTIQVCNLNSGSPLSDIRFIIHLHLRSVIHKTVCILSFYTKRTKRSRVCAISQRWKSEISGITVCRNTCARLLVCTQIVYWLPTYNSHVKFLFYTWYMNKLENL